MPNWCDNKLEITASQEAMEFIESKYCCDGMLKLENIVQPEAATVEAHRAAWGTKWDLDDSDAVYAINDEVDLIGKPTGYKVLTMSFDTAWSPPVDAFYVMHEELKNRFGDSDEPTIKLTYIESANGFAGVWEDGNEASYDSDTKQYKELFREFGYEDDKDPLNDDSDSSAIQDPVN